MNGEIMQIKRNGYTISVSEPTLYVDNKSRFRSGHMTHAMVELPNGKIVNFNANSSALRFNGHSTYGWVEYRISNDGGKTYSPIRDLPYAKKAFEDGMEMISVEKAVACDDGTIVAICLRNAPMSVCQPWNTPTVIYSKDEGETWSEPYELCTYRGRVYDAVYEKGVIYALEFCNDGEGNFCGHRPEHLYRLFVSKNNGESFEELCVVPLPTEGRSYAAMLFDKTGRLHIYAYNVNDEYNGDYIYSDDFGKTWSVAETCRFAKGIRNPQCALVDGVYVLHARGGDMTGFVLYTSLDGKTWDEGVYLQDKRCLGYYSNNVLTKDEKGKNTLMIQYSDPYELDRVNVMHQWLKIENE